MADGLRAAAPLISIIVPTRNSASLLPGAMESLARQRWRDFEVVVSDGASTDGTPEIASSFKASLPGLVVETRPDQGVYDAINRGIRLSSGAWFLVLGSDDRLHDAATLEAVASHLVSEQSAEVVYGDVRMMAANQCGVPVGGRFAGEVPLDWLLSANVCQQSVFYRRSLFEALGGFNLRYRLYSDWDFNLRSAFRARWRWIDIIVADYAATGMSATAVDRLFVEDMPALVREELVRRSADRRTWPAQRRLLKFAKQLRKQRRWSQALSYYGAYWRLVGTRIAAMGRGA